MRVHGDEVGDGLRLGGPGFFEMRNTGGMTTSAVPGSNRVSFALSSWLKGCAAKICSAAAKSTRLLFGVRWLLGRWFGWDDGVVLPGNVRAGE